MPSMYNFEMSSYASLHIVVQPYDVSTEWNGLGEKFPVAFFVRAFLDNLVRVVKTSLCNRSDNVDSGLVCFVATDSHIPN